MAHPMNRRAALGALTGTGAMLGATASTAAVGALSPDTSEAKSLATFDQLAAMEFEPWKDDNGPGFTLPTRDEWFEGAAEAYQTLTMAWSMLLKTKPELEELARGLDEQDLHETLSKNLIRAEKAFQGVATVVRTADLRLMSAMLSYLKRERPDEFAEL